MATDAPRDDQAGEDPLADYVDVHEAGELLGIRSRSVNRLIRSRRLNASRFFGKNFIDRSEFEVFAAGYRRQGAGQRPGNGRTSP